MHALLLALAPALAAGPLAKNPSAEEILSAGPFAVQLESTRLVAVNRSLEPYVLILASPGRGHLVARAVQPGAILVAEHPPHALTGLLLEVLAAPNGRWTTSGGLILEGHEQTLVFGNAERTPPGAGLAIHTERALSRGPSFLPRAQQPQEPAPLHVPIPPPSDKPPGETPPPVEDEPLPPV